MDFRKSSQSVRHDDWEHMNKSDIIEDKRPRNRERSRNRATEKSTGRSGS